MKTILSWLSLIFLCHFSFGQLTDNFSDGDFSANPSWLGDVGKFVVTDGVLSLSDQDAASSNNTSLFLEAMTSSASETTWEVFVNLDFAPSSSNFAKIYLAALSNDFANDPDGYFLKIGGISGSDDAIELVLQEGQNQTVLISGQIGGAGSQPVTASIRVVRDVNHNWTLATDYLGGTNFQIEGNATDDTFTQGLYFGLTCIYTRTRNENFQFDNVLISPIVVDETPPTLLSASAIDANTVEVIFDEAISPSSLSIDQFSIAPSIGNPSGVSIDPEQSNVILLSLPTALENFTNYTLTAENIQDNNGNTMPVAQSAEFSFLEISTALPGEILITEIMADPNPVRGLPEVEFIELYNNSNKVFNLANIGFSSGSTPKKINTFQHLPGSYIIICDEDDAALFESFGAVATISGFPSLTNGGDELSLTNGMDEVIFEVSYSDTWYKDFEKSNGGWTLELVNLEGPIDCSNNWFASNNDQGGTPGQANSWLGQNPDQTGPDLLLAVPEGEEEIIITFNESIDPNSLSPANIQISPDLGVSAVFAIPPSNESVLISLDDPIQRGIVYTVNILESVTDCIGNPIQQTISVSLGITETPVAGDIIINEILFDPESGGEDFVELYNLSNKIINFKDFALVNTAKETGNTIQVIENDFLIFPQSYAVVTDLPEDIMMRYTTGEAKFFVENDLPTLDANAGNITIRYNNEDIDAFDYEDDDHFGLLDNDKGVSLERISPNGPTQDKGNWHSASATVGFATPGLPNSQLQNTSNILDDMIVLPEKTISPDGDGHQDVLVIQYQTDAPGYILNAKVFDIEGREIAYIINQQLLGNQGVFNWDGLTNDQSRARIGIYVLWFELFDQEGNVTTQKRPIVVAGKLE